MAYIKPTLKEIIDRMMNDTYSIVTLGVGFFRKAFLSIIIKTCASANFLQWNYISNLAKQFFLSTVDDEDYLKVHGQDWNVPRREGTKSIGEATISGAIGAQATAGDVVTNNDGLEYTIVNTVILVSGTGTVQLTASEIGNSYDLVEGDLLTFTNTPTDLDDSLTVKVGGISGGSNLEDFDSWRDRILSRKQNSAKIGKEEDYIQWVKNYSGLAITRVWISVTEIEFNNVYIYFVMDASAPITPNSSQILAVYNYLLTKKPVTINLQVFAPTLKEVTYTMDLSPNTTLVQNNVESNLEEYFLNNTELGMTLLISQINEAISLATGETDHTITAIEVDGESVPIDDISFGNNELPSLGLITYN